MIKSNKTNRKRDIPDGYRMYGGRGYCTNCNIRIKKGYQERIEISYENVETLTCRTCGEILSLDRFELNSKTSIRRKSICRLCNILKYSYHITKAQYLELLESQGNRCAICRRDASEFNRSLCVDHDHNCCPESAKSCGKCVRGLLCHGCNQGLGVFKENIAALSSAIDYLNKYNVEKD